MNTILWKPTLAATLPPDADLDALPYPLYASPKIDGVRAMVQRGRVVSRNGREIPQPKVQRLFGKADYEGLDGELTLGPPHAADVFTRTSGYCMRHSTVSTVDKLHFNVFDWRIPAGWPVRLEYLTAFDGGRAVVMVKQTRVIDAARLLAFEARCLKQGYEGVMLRRADAGPYLEKRSTLREFYLVKLKRFDHGFGEIVAVHPLRHNLNTAKTAAGRRSTVKTGISIDHDSVGSVTLRDGAHEFSVNVQTDALRAKGPTWWARQVGKRVRYTHQSVGRKDAPRFPQCKFEELL